MGVNSLGVERLGDPGFALTGLDEEMSVGLDRLEHDLFSAVHSAQVLL